MQITASTDGKCMHSRCRTACLYGQCIHALTVTVCVGSHVLRQVVKVLPIAMLVGGSQTLCCHLNCKLVPQLVPMIEMKRTSKSVKALKSLDTW